MGFFLITVVIIITLFAGIFGGLFIAKMIQLREDKKLQKNAVEVIEGKRENVLEIDGVRYDASKFKVRGEDDKEYLIDIKGGVTEANGRKSEEEPKETQSEEREIPSTDRGIDTTNGENVRGTRKKKRNSRRLRRHG